MKTINGLQEITKYSLSELSKAYMCSCSECGWKGKCADCETGMESEGGAYLEYPVHICPKCEDGGCIDDYWMP